MSDRMPIPDESALERYRMLVADTGLRKELKQSLEVLRMRQKQLTKDLAEADEQEIEIEAAIAALEKLQRENAE